MRAVSALILVFCAGVAWAQSEDGEVVAAKGELARVQGLVSAGLLPPASLAKAEEGVADARDSSILRHAPNGSELDVSQADDMVGAAKRRVERRQRALDAAAKLVEAGAASQNSVRALADDLDEAKREVELAESRAQLIHELSEMADAEGSALDRLAREAAPTDDPGGPAAFATYAKVEVAFREHFGKAMPISAMGQTAVHRSMGFDHRGRVDVALNPDQPEGEWLVEYLKQHHIPYFAFTQAVKGKATGAHIHIGPMSTRVIVAE